MAPAPEGLPPARTRLYTPEKQVVTVKNYSPHFGRACAFYLTTAIWLSLPATAATQESTLSQPHNAFLIADLDVQEVRRLKESGEIKPLEQLLRQVRNRYPGRVIEIELEQEDGRYVYELELVDDRGVLWDMEFDARTGQLLERERDD